MYKISEDECTACGTCIDECPVEANSGGEEFYTIDLESLLNTELALMFALTRPKKCLRKM